MGLFFLTSINCDLYVQCPLEPVSDVRVPGHGRDVVDSPNSTEKKFIYKLMENVQLPGVKGYNRIEMHNNE